METLSLNHQLKNWYYNPKETPSFGGARKLLSKTKARESENVKKWLSAQDAYTLHKPFKKNFTRRKTVAGGIGKQLQADLMDVSNVAKSNGGTHFLLTAIDVVSRFAYVERLVSKHGERVAEKLKHILRKTSPHSIQTDKGKEFYNKHVGRVMSQNNVKHFSTNDDEVKASMVERFNRTLRERMSRYMTYTRSNRYAEALEDMVDSYNQTVNAATGLAPSRVNADNQEDLMLREWDNDVARHGAQSEKRLAVGDFVRVTARRMAFTRGYRPKWTEEIFTVASVDTDGSPTTYTLKDWSEEMLQGVFYFQELQKIAKPETFQVERIIKQRRYKKTKSKEYLVKWLGYPDTFNSWEHEDNIDK